ncbi:MAG: response regulator [Anaerolineaceae bacterium]|nr:response regulator [Anaerolineaceae bacterium]
MPTVLVVDDEADILNIFRMILANRGYTVVTADCGREAQFMLEIAAPDMAILDDMLPDMTGGDICTQIKRENPGMPVVMCSAGARVRDEEYIRRIGADRVLLKPFKSSEVMKILNHYFGVGA